MLDVGPYQLNPQAACQRYRQTKIDAKSTLSDAVDRVLAGRQFAPAYA